MTCWEMRLVKGGLEMLRDKVEGWEEPAEGCGRLTLGRELFLSVQLNFENMCEIQKIVKYFSYVC